MFKNVMSIVFGIFFLAEVVANITHEHYTAAVLNAIIAILIIVFLIRRFIKIKNGESTLNKKSKNKHKRDENNE